MSTPTPEAFKEKAAVIRKFFKEKYNVDVSQGHALDLASKVLGFKDWNTASAASKSKVNQNPDSLPVLIRTVDGMRKALEPFKGSAKLDASGILAIGAVLKDLDALGLTEKSAFFSKYSFIVGETDAESVSLVLKLEDQTIGELNAPEADFTVDDVDFLEM